MVISGDYSEMDMIVEELQIQMREAESKIAAVIQSLEKNGIRFKDLDVERIEATSKDSPGYPRPYYFYKCSIRTEIESWS